MQRATVFVRGHVQGVGFRWWTRSQALELGLVGFARNMGDGRVEMWLQGERAAIDRLRERLEEQPSRHGRPGQVESCLTQWGEPRGGMEGFVER